VNHLLAVLGLAAACACWLFVQRFTGRSETGCCGAKPREQRSRDCDDCPDRPGAAAGGLGGGALLLLAVVLQAGCASAPAGGELPRHAGERMLMGTRFAIEIESADRAGAEAAIEAAFAEVARVEELLSEWKDTSEISELNRRAGQGPVAVGPEFLELALSARKMSELTDGAFDVTFAPCWALWDFRTGVVPTDREREDCTALVGWRGLLIDEGASTVELGLGGMRIGISGIGKGYGVDRAASVLEERGFTSYLVDGGGDVRLSGRPWTVGVAHPRRSGELLGRLEVSEGSIVTSGDYYRYFERDGLRYHHILDPRSGMPARVAVAVTLIAPDATSADALATGLFVLGPERGIELAESLPGVEVLFVLPDLTQRRSSGFPQLLSSR
jgi:thiamine biosynthesis lipoprotein